MTKSSINQRRSTNCGPQVTTDDFTGKSTWQRSLVQIAAYKVRRSTRDALVTNYALPSSWKAAKPGTWTTRPSPWFSVAATMTTIFRFHSVPTARWPSTIRAPIREVAATLWHHSPATTCRAPKRMWTRTRNEGACASWRPIRSWKDGSALVGFSTCRSTWCRRVLVQDHRGLVVLAVLISSGLDFYIYSQIDSSMHFVERRFLIIDFLKFL